MESERGPTDRDDGHEEHGASENSGSHTGQSEASGDHEQGCASDPPALPVAPAVKPRERATIMDLARFKEGQRVWWVVFRADESPEFQRGEEWMKREHPWMLWRRKIVPWGLPMRPPRAHPGDTMAIMMLCAQRPKIEAFRITSVERSVHSGEFLYTGPKGMIMPENLLFPTRKAARQEIARLARLFATWTGSWAAGEEGKGE